MAFWWVNQGQTYAQERRASLLWAPVVSRGGYRVGHWDAMTLLRAGDEILHYANGAVRASSTVLGPAELVPRPADMPATWETEGRRAHVHMIDAEPPVRLEEIPVDLRLGETGGPFDRNGRIKQGYLFPLSLGFAETYSSLFGVRFDGVTTTGLVERDEDEAETGGVLPQDPELRKAIERYAVEETLTALSARYGRDSVIEMPPNNPGFDITVKRSKSPDLYIEVKGTARRLPVFLMSEVERAFSADNSARYELHVVWGIDLKAAQHAGVEVRSGEVGPTTHGLLVQRWQGRIK